MQQEKYILSAAALINGKVFKDQELLFHSDKLDLSSFLLDTYNRYQLNYPKFYKMDLLSKLGWLNAEILLQNNNLIKTFKPEEIALVFCNNNASLDTDIKYYHTVHEFASPALFVYTLPNIMMGEICIRNNFKGENGFFIFNKFDASFLQQYVSSLLDDQITKICLCGWIDVLEDHYRSVMFLVSKGNEKNSMPFDTSQLDQYYNQVMGKK